jgi:hypothetical protein
MTVSRLIASGTRQSGLPGSSAAAAATPPAATTIPDHSATSGSGASHQRVKVTR